MLMLNMPKESRRSTGYRPFITCDDPRGVVECGTIRKQKNLNTVSGGAQKLNHVVSSWSCGYSKNNERDMAKDLLKGALDLSKLQHSSDCVSEPAKKRLQKKTLIEELQDVRSHGARLSGSSMHEFEEIKNVFSDPFSHDRRLDSSEEPSTSSSQSSIVHSSIFVSPESLLSSTDSQKKKNSKKPRGSNLIAKLMNLEYGRKHLDDGEKVVNQQKPKFDHDPCKLGRKSRTVDQMIDALKFKGNFKPSPNSHHSEFSDPKQSRGSVKRDHWSPIALMKPSRFSCLNLDNPIIPKPRAEVNEEILFKMTIRTNPLAEANGFECRRKGERKRRTKSESHLQFLDEDKLAILRPMSSRGAKITEIDIVQNTTTGNSKRNWLKKAEEETDNAVSLVNDKQTYKDKCERESSMELEDSTRLVEDASLLEITDYVDCDQSSSNETLFSPSSSSNQTNTNTTLIFPDECTMTNHEEEDYVCVNSRKASNDENKLKELLQSSPPFINRVHKLLDLKGNRDRDVLHIFGNEIDHNDLNAKMLLDSANELVDSATCYYTSLNQILDEVCEEIESLGRYRKDGADTQSTDNLLLLVKEDLRSRRMVTGVWDIGWRNVASADEIEEITRGVDQIVLDELIQEILVDLLLSSI